MINIDLHIHSKYSLDGEFTPTEIIDFASKSDIEYLSITDHNTVKGVQEAIDYAKDRNITVIPGIEIDCLYKNITLHILGYFIDLNNPIYKELEETISNREKDAGITRLRLIEELGFKVDMDKLKVDAPDGIYTGRMLACNILNNELNKDNPIVKNYIDNKDSYFNINNVFHSDYFDKGKPAYVKVEYISLEDGMKIVKDTGGLVILAHPGKDTKENLNLLNEIMSLGFDGLEAYSSYHSNIQKEFYRTYAIKNDYLMTLGSDFYGKAKPSISLSSVISDLCCKRMIKTLENYQASKNI